jgi:hypothetical protein
MTLGFARRSIEYEAVMTDLALMGAIPKEVCEAFTGVKFADYLKPPAAFTADDEPAKQTTEAEIPEDDE